MGTGKGLKGDKIVIATAVTGEGEYNLHPWLIIKLLRAQRNSTYKLFLKMICACGSQQNNIHNEYGYDNLLVLSIIVRVWDYAQDVNKNLKVALNGQMSYVQKTSIGRIN